MESDYTRNEFAVGAFLIAGLGASIWLALTLGGLHPFKHDEYRLVALFTSSSGLKEGAAVEVGGVRVGRVTHIELDPKTYRSRVEFTVPVGVEIQEDAIASVRTAGIIGDKFLKLSPGGSDVLLGPGDVLFDTESSISIEELVSKYIFEGTE